MEAEAESEVDHRPREGTKYLGRDLCAGAFQVSLGRDATNHEWPLAVDHFIVLRSVRDGA
jgi:hypothetical protein